MSEQKSLMKWPFPSFEAPSPTVVLYEVRLLKDGRPDELVGRTLQSGLRYNRPAYFFNWGEAAGAIREYQDDGGNLGDLGIAVVPLQYDPLRVITEVLNEYGLDDVNDRLAGVCDRVPVELPPIAVEREVFRMNEGWADPVGLAIEVADLWNEIDALRAVDGEVPIGVIAETAADGGMPEDPDEIKRWAQVIYFAYPKKMNPKSAIREITYLLQSGEVGPTELLSATERYAMVWKDADVADRRRIHHPTTWYRTRAFRKYLPEPPK